MLLLKDFYLLFKNSTFLLIGSYIFRRCPQKQQFAVKYLELLEMGAETKNVLDLLKEIRDEPSVQNKIAYFKALESQMEIDGWKLDEFIQFKPACMAHYCLMARWSQEMEGTIRITE
jgi:hypothetical protein